MMEEVNLEQSAKEVMGSIIKKLNSSIYSVKKIPDAELIKIRNAIEPSLTDDKLKLLESSNGMDLFIKDVVAALDVGLRVARQGLIANTVRTLRFKHHVSEGDHTIHKNDLKIICSEIDKLNNSSYTIATTPITNAINAAKQQGQGRGR